jgi:drug/metabolite transporter (DMT)-like permease
MKNFLLILVTVIINTSGQLVMKSGMNKVGAISIRDNLFRGLWSAVTNLHVILGFTFYVVSAALWLVILSKVQLSWAFPMLSLSYVLVVLLSRVLLQETLSAQKLLGTIVIVIGVALVSRTPS